MACTRGCFLGLHYSFSYDTSYLDGTHCFAGREEVGSVCLAPVCVLGNWRSFAMQFGILSFEDILSFVQEFAADLSSRTLPTGDKVQLCGTLQRY